jgi:hypothetical protein
MAKIGENWKCPYCGHAQVLDRKRVYQHWYPLHVAGWKSGSDPFLGISSVVCANNGCKELSLSADLANGAHSPASGDIKITAVLQTWVLLPPSSAKPQPDYIPAPIRDDYYEACAIRDLSPKASATITRRCLQGMIRDFCGISKPRLIEEIKELRTRVQNGNAPPGVQPDTVEAIDHVRGIGNIGAHMEADINLIIDVDSDEAQILIGLTELLFDEWYVARESRTKRLDQLKSIAEDKEQKKLSPPEGSAQN